MNAPISDPARTPAANDPLGMRDLRQDAILLAVILLAALLCGFLFPELLTVLVRVF